MKLKLSYWSKPVPKKTSLNDKYNKFVFIIKHNVMKPFPLKKAIINLKK